MIADSSFLVSLFLSEDVNHTRAKKEFLANEKHILIPISVFEETVNIFVYRRGITFCLGAINELLQNENIIIYYTDENEVLDAIELMSDNKRKMSLIDYEVAYFAAQKNEDLLCFDKQILSLTANLKRKKNS